MKRLSCTYVSASFWNPLTEFNPLITFYRCEFRIFVFFSFLYNKFKIQIRIIYWFIVEMVAFEAVKIVSFTKIIPILAMTLRNVLHFLASFRFALLRAILVVVIYQPLVMLSFFFSTTVYINSILLGGPITFTSFGRGSYSLCHKHTKCCGFPLSRFSQFVIILLHGTFTKLNLLDDKAELQNE